MKLDTQKARTEPEDVFATPAELVAEIGLTKGQKIAALKRWAETVEARLDATSEGMSVPPGEATEDAELMRNIELARLHLEQEA